MSGRRAAATTALASLALATLGVLGPATPAGADPGMSVSVNEPEVDGAHATISGSVQMAGGLDWVTGVTVSATSRRHPATGDSCDECGATLNQGPSTPYSWTTRDFDYNGPYDVVVVGTGQRILDVVTQTSVSTEGHATFNLEIDPAPPADVRAEANPDRSVTVSWARNGEPDLVGYQVRRAGAGGSGLQTVVPAVAQADGPRLSWTDTSTAQTGGQFEYSVVAVRPDGEGNITDRATSVSTSRAVTVPVPPGAPPAAGTPGAPGGPPGAGPGAIATPGPGGTFTSGSPGGLDLSSFLSSGGTPAGIAVPGGVVLPDGTFSPTLPFGSRDIDEPGDDSVEILGRSTSRRTLLLPIATGLLMCVVALHLRRFNRRVLAPPLEP